MSTILLILAVWFAGSTIIGMMLGRFMARTQRYYPVAESLHFDDTQPRPATFILRTVHDD